MEARLIDGNVHGLGQYESHFFSTSYFRHICAEHVFQSLTESNKPGTAHRTGIYLTPVVQQGPELHFRLLRCSTNLSGPTDNFRATDRAIVEALNERAAALFENAAPLNHVLAQVYHNTPAGPQQKQTKAKISAHADKTKDMPRHGIMAFCTFYDGLEGKGENALTKLRFRVKEDQSARVPAEFTVTLHDSSVFFMPLSTNRFYTHEIISPPLDAAKLPTRLGYVVRCSSTEAVHKGGHTFIRRGDKEMQLAPETPEGVAELRKMYADENRTSGFIDYGDRFLFSMNKGDYAAPLV